MPGRSRESRATNVGSGCSHLKAWGSAPDAFFPFRDNLDRAAISGVKYVVQAGGSKRDQDVIDATNEHDMVMAMTGLRLFLH